MARNKAGAPQRYARHEGFRRARGANGNLVRRHRRNGQRSLLAGGRQGAVYLDGKLERVVDVCSDEDQAKIGESVWHIFGLRNGKHKIRLVVAGEPGPGSKGNDVTIEDLVVFR